MRTIHIGIGQPLGCAILTALAKELPLQEDTVLVIGSEPVKPISIPIQLEIPDLRYDVIQREKKIYRPRYNQKVPNKFKYRHTHKRSWTRYLAK